MLACASGVRSPKLRVVQIRISDWERSANCVRVCVAVWTVCERESMCVSICVCGECMCVW